MPTEVQMPKLGESVVEGTVSKWLKKEGEAVAEYEPLLEVSTDKVDTEVPAPADGVLLKILVAEGQTVAIGALLCLIGEPGEAVTVVPAAPAKVAAVAAPEPNNGQKTAPSQPIKVKGPHITPVVAKIAAEHGLDVAVLRGTGAGGRVTKKDILAYVENEKQRPLAKPSPAAMPWDQPGSGDLFAPTDKIFEQNLPPAPAPVSPPAQIIPFTGVRKLIADHMVLSKRTSPHVTTVMEADCTALVDFYQQRKADFERRVGLKLTYTPIFIAAIIEGLKAAPLVNSVLTERGIELQPHINIGMAVALDDGLIVPVIKNADELNLTGLQRAVTGLATRARNRRLAPDDVQGGTFTFTNHGVSGSLLATPIINQPQVGILGAGKIEKRVVVVSRDGVDAIAIKPMCYLSFTFDHRILDGAGADKFLGVVKQTLETWH